MAKTSRRRASSIFDSTSMKRFTGFFGGSPASEEVVQEKVQEQVPQTSTPPPLPPLNTNIRQQRSDSLQTPITALNGTPTSGIAPKTTRTFSMPLPSSPHVQDPTLVHPKRVESLSLAPAPAHPSIASGSLSPYLHPSSSPVGSSQASRNFSGASAMSGMSGMSGISVVSAASYTSYGSSRPTSSQAQAQAQVPMPPSPTTADIPRQFKGKKGRHGIFNKKRKDDVEIPAAWRLAHGSSENLEGYNFGPLTRGGQVPDLWDPTGDTLVFLAPRNAAKSVAPSFRINSGPLMFAALGQYIEDLQFSEGPEDSQDLFLEVPRGVPSAPFKQDNRPGSAPTSSRPGGEDLSGQPGILDQLAQTGEGDSFMDQYVAYKVYYPPTDSEPKSSVPVKGKKHKHSNSDPNNDSFQRLIDVRNLFAFLNYTFLVSTLHRETPFQIMEKIFKQLQGPHSPELHAEDLNLSRRINAAEGNFLYYVEELKIDDIRNDDDAIIEALIMGERWRCQRLYREGFIHASGRWEDIKGHSGLQYISQETKKRLDRSSLNLHQIRLYNVTTGLTNFDYPSVWVGDDKYPELKPWKAGFEAMRKLTLSFYKNVYGSWPPKAGKHGKGGGYTETGGLNRLVLKRLYDDFCVLYDLLVDREWIHGERIRFESTYFSEGEEGKEQRTKEETARNALRKIMATLDNSTVPVQPNIPFDQPRLLHIPATAPSAEKKKSKKPRSQKKLKSDELAVVLKNSYNEDTTERAKQNEFAKAYLKLEADFAKGKNLDDIIEARRGRWIFMYCVLQNLPMTVVDAVGCQYGDGVEYFLCENVKGSLPWERSNNRASRMSGIWGVSGPYGGLGPAGSSSNLNGDDEIDYTYRRSHCFDIAEDWRMVQRVPGADDEFEMDGESGGEEFIEYRPLDQPMPDSPKAESPMSPSGLSPAPFRQSYPNSERSQSQSPEINNEGGYVPYHQQGAAQSRENILSETYQPTYRPLTYMPAAPSESERPQSYGSQKSLSSQEAPRIKSLPPLDFEGPNADSQTNSTIVMIPMSPTHKDDAPASIESQMDRAFVGRN